MKQWIFVAMVVVSSLGFAEGSSQPDTHGAGTKVPQSSSGGSQVQAPKVDSATKLNQLVNACLVGQGNSKSNGNLSRTSR
jgi:hypothetical protein